MTYYFLLTYNDDRSTDVEGLYACDYEVTKEQWQDFRAREWELRARMRTEMVPLESPRNRVLRPPEYVEQVSRYIEWDRNRPGPGKLFIEAHKMRKIDFVDIDD